MLIVDAKSIYDKFKVESKLVHETKETPDETSVVDTPIG